MSRIHRDQIPAYIRDERFSQTFTDDKTGRTVFFADCGAAAGLPVMFLLPSSNNRMLACIIDRLAQSKELRIVCMERPGSGKSPPCNPEERLELSTALQVSLMNHLKIDKAHLVSHSGGVAYLLNLMRQYPERLFDTPKIALISPWAKSAHFSPFDLAPTFGLQLSQYVIPSLLPVLGVSGRFISNSGSWFTKAGRKMGLPQSPPPRYAKFTERWFDTDEMNRQIISLAVKEPCQGMVQEYMMCLARGPYKNLPGSGRQWMSETIHAMPSFKGKIQTRMVYGEGDSIVAKDSRQWLPSVLEGSGQFDVQVRNMVEEGHDDVLFLEEGLGWAFDGFVKE